VGKHKCFLALVASRAALTDSRRFFGKEKGAAMKFATVSKSFVMGLALLLASSAFAGVKANLQLSNPVSVNGTKLKAGDYKLAWEGTGNVELSIMQGKTVVAKVPARVVDLSTASANSAAVTTTNGDGSKSLSGVRFEGKKIALELGESSDGMQAGSSK
jgi:hypothetical protein